jgi:RNA polymerase sigma-70 factor (ECF subfamily)
MRRPTEEASSGRFTQGGDGGLTNQARTSTKAQPDWEQFRGFYRETLPVVYGYLLSRCGGGPAVAQDLTQETFVAALQAAKRGTADLSVAWAVGIARHKLLDHFRREARAERKLTLAYENRRPEELPDWDEEHRDRALRSLERVAPPQRAALVLRYLDGLSVPEVAARLGRSVHATESLLARGREGFRRAFREGQDD